MYLNQTERAQLEKQVAAHQHEKYEIDIDLGFGNTLNGFIVNPKVMRPEKMVSSYLAKWLFFNQPYFKSKKVLDMGSGAGIQGIILGTFGAQSVTFADLSTASVQNTNENVSKFKLASKSNTLNGDLFENITDKFDLIVFNHPFFSDHTYEELLEVFSKEGKLNISRGKLIHRFFEDAKNHLNPNGTIIMPYFLPAGEINNPFVQAPKHGYEVIEKSIITIKTGLQLGPAAIYEIKPKNTNTQTN